MTKKASPTPLPPADSLPGDPTAHPVLHNILRKLVYGISQRSIAQSLKVDVAYVRAVKDRYLREAPG